MKRTILMMALTVMTGCAAALLAQDAPRPPHPVAQGFMRQKLNFSQNILEGIVLEKYDLVITNATLLRNMNMTNAFLALRNPDYMVDITNFQQKVDILLSAAKERNLENSTAAYTQMTGSCIACHKQFRRGQLSGGVAK
jgi:hypothetical protein